ncbi:MAG: CPBP family intramembrane metalloprotease [Planctomycetes bacterium]|nr:CPBP family intramembrane metalloprotease [Planctomycetota bacterium]
MDRRRSLAALLLVVPLPSLGVLASMYVAPGPIGAGVWVATKVFFVAAPLLWLLFVEGGRLSLSPARRGGFGFGVASGVVLSLAVLAFWIATHGRWIDGAKLRELAIANGIGQRGSYFAIAAYTVLLNSLIEEYAWRWFVYSHCAKLASRGTAVVLSAAAFTLHHTLLLNAQFGLSFALVASVGVFIAGAFWSWLYARYESVWPAWASHALVDATLLAIGWRLIFGVN